MDNDNHHESDVSADSQLLTPLVNLSRTKEMDQEREFVHDPKTIENEIHDGYNSKYIYGAIDSDQNNGINSEYNGKHESHKDHPTMKHTAILSILSTSFAYTNIMTTFFLLTGPLECTRIEEETSKYYSYTISKSIALGGFAGLAGLSQLITPLIGLLSDCYNVPVNVPTQQKFNDERYKYGGLYKLGKRMPYLILGTVMVVGGLFGLLWSSSPVHRVVMKVDVNVNSHAAMHGRTSASSTDVVYSGAWIQYSLFFLITNLGLNIVYTIMLVLIPDLGTYHTTRIKLAVCVSIKIILTSTHCFFLTTVPPSQTGMANGSLALLLVSGSLFGFFSFHILLDNNVVDMYKMYIIVSFVTAVLTCVSVFEREDELKKQRMTMNGNETIEQSQPHQYDDTTSESVAVEQQNTDSMPPLHIFIYLILYEPIMNKSSSELLSAFWIDTSQHSDFFIVTLSRFFYYMGISSQTFFLYFIHDVLRHSVRTENPEAAVALLAIIGQSAGAITCYPVGILSDKYFNGRRKPFVYTAW